jgi:hypothetical protein
MQKTLGEPGFYRGRTGTEFFEVLPVILPAGFEGLLWDFKRAPPFSARKPLLGAA